MDALQAAQSIYDSTIRNVANTDVELEADYALRIATFCATLAQAEATERVAMQLGNIHQALITPNAEREPITVADLLERIAASLDNLSGGYTTATFGYYPPMAEGIVNPEEHDPVGPSPLDNY